jgi:hypothetical protein
MTAQDLCPKAMVHVFDMRRELPLPLHDYAATKAILEGAAPTSQGTLTDPASSADMQSSMIHKAWLWGHCRGGGD